MKKCSSVVWRFFDRITDGDKRCVSVLCKLCDSQYKYFGNTTNLRVHLTNKHPIQWELTQNGTLDETQFRIEDEESNQSTITPKRRKYTKAKNVRYSVSVDNSMDESTAMPKIEIQRVDVLENSETETEQVVDHEESEATINLVRQMHNRASDEEWLEEDPYQTTHIEMYEPKRKKMKYKKIKQEIQSPNTHRLSDYVVHTPLKYDKPERIILDSPKKDEYSVFGEYVANKLRKFTAPRTRGNIQQLITTILWQAEYGMYDNAETVKRVLMYSVQEPEQVQEQEIQIQTEEIREEVREEEPNQSTEGFN